MKAGCVLCYAEETAEDEGVALAPRLLASAIAASTLAHCLHYGAGYVRGGLCPSHAEAFKQTAALVAAMMRDRGASS